MVGHFCKHQLVKIIVFSLFLELVGILLCWVVKFCCGLCNGMLHLMLALHVEIFFCSTVRFDNFFFMNDIWCLFSTKFDIYYWRGFSVLLWFCEATLPRLPKDNLVSFFFPVAYIIWCLVALVDLCGCMVSFHANSNFLIQFADIVFIDSF